MRKVEGWGVSIALTRSVKTHPSLPWLCPCSPFCRLLSLPFPLLPAVTQCRASAQSSCFSLITLLNLTNTKQHRLPLQQRQWWASREQISAENRQLALLEMPDKLDESAAPYGSVHQSAEKRVTCIFFFIDGIKSNSHPFTPLQSFNLPVSVRKKSRSTSTFTMTVTCRSAHPCQESW